MKNTVTIEREAPKTILESFSRSLLINSKIPLSPATARAKGDLAREASAIFAKDIEKNSDILDMRLSEAIKAADVTDTSIGLLAGTLVLQRSLPMLQYEYPMLNTVFTDFDDTPGLLNQTEIAHIPLKPAVQTYNPATDTSGRPKGWDTVSPAQTVDVPVKLDEYVGVPIVFGVQTLAQTVRKLFEETAPQALYAIGGYFVNKLAALLTAGNFNAYAATSVGGGVTTSGGNACQATSTANMYQGQEIGGTGIPLRCYVSKIVDGTNFTITQNATATGSGLTFTLGGGRVPATYATYAEAIADFNMASLGLISAALDSNEVPQLNRFVMLNSGYYHRLTQDPSINNFFAAMRMPEIITKGQLPELQGFTPQKAPWFPSDNNRVGFAYHRSAAILKTRLPQDFTQAVGATVPGSVTTVTVPSGLSVLLVQYVNLQSDYAEWRPEIMLGAAVGEHRAGLVITSQ